MVTGCTTSVCVESTVRDAFYRDYLCIVLSDCTAEPIGRRAEGYVGMKNEDSSGTEQTSNYEASMVLYEALFGWVSDARAVTSALSVSEARSEMPKSVGTSA